METPKYSARFIDADKVDIRVFEIKKSNVTLPWTIIVFDHSKVGDRQMFSDIFYSSDWDEKRGEDGFVSDDIKFCIGYWKELGLDKLHGNFSPSHVQFDEKRIPAVYRKDAEEVIMKKFGGTFV